MYAFTFVAPGEARIFYSNRVKDVETSFGAAMARLSI
jgi:hypothetical protein